VDDFGAEDRSRYEAALGMVGYFAFRTPWGCFLLSTSEPLDDNVRVRIDVLLDPVAFAAFRGGLQDASAFALL